MPWIFALAPGAATASGGWTSGAPGLAQGKTPSAVASELCDDYAPVYTTVTEPGSTGGRLGVPAEGDRFTLVASGAGTGTWRIVGDPSGWQTLVAGGTFPGTLTYTYHAPADVRGLGFFVDTYSGSGDTITGSCVSASSVIEIPTLSGGAMVALVLTLALVGVVALVRRRRHRAGGPRP